MTRRVSPTYNFAVLYPAYAELWHQARNHPLGPSDVMPGAQNRKYWWICPAGHEYDRCPSDQVRFKGLCPVCTGSRVGADNNLAVLWPDVASQWHPTKNGKLGPQDVLPKSNKQVWWLCAKGHDHPMRVHQKTEGAGCPFCTGRRASPDDNLAVRFPEIAKEWHPSKNGDLLPSDVRYGSDRKAWWLCHLGHVWKTSMNTRTSGRSCPHCRPKTSRLEIFIYSELLHVFGSVGWRDIMDGMEVDILIPQYRVAVEVDGEFWHRDKADKDLEKTRRLKALGYHVFRVREEGLPLTSEYDVITPTAVYRPEVVCMLLSNIRRACGSLSGAQGAIDAYLQAASHQNECLFQKMVSQMALPPEAKSLRGKFPSVAESWHPSMNGDLLPNMFGSRSEYKAWWQCSFHGPYNASISVQSDAFKNGRKLCPICRKSSRKSQMGADLHL